jgi:hypothetical protein
LIPASGETENIDNNHDNHPARIIGEREGIRETVEDTKNSDQVRFIIVFDICGTHNLHSRTFLPEGVKTKSWDDRMEKTQRAMAIKRLESELKEEKVAEMKR